MGTPVPAYPETLQDWADHHKILNFELWNEPDVPGFFSGYCKDYRELILKPGYRGVKRANRKTSVAGPALAFDPTRTSSGDYLKNLDYLDCVLQNGGWDNLDIITIHAYPHESGCCCDNGFYDRIKSFVRPDWADGSNYNISIKSIMTVHTYLEKWFRTNGRKEFWITETGSTSDGPLKLPSGKTMSGMFCLNQDKQNTFYRGMLNFMDQTRIAEKIFFWTLADANIQKSISSSNEKYVYYGLVDYDRTQKKSAFNTLKSYTEFSE